VNDNQGNLDNLQHAIDRVNEQYRDADMVIVTGDMVGCLFSEDTDDYWVGQPNPAETFKLMMDELTSPYYPLLGNHDYQKDYVVTGGLLGGEGVTTDDPLAIEAVWKKVLGIDPYYSFVHEGIRFIMLNSSRGEKRDAVCLLSNAERMCTGSFDDTQLDWLEAELQNAEPCLVFLHHPVIGDSGSSVIWSLGFSTFQVEADDRFYDVIEAQKDNVKAMFVGHGHMWATDTLNGIPVYETGSIGDSSSDGDNMHIVTVADDGSCSVQIGKEGASY
jgi:3',5'-cyclic AMP phosphodiesterase CpdA